MKYVKLLGGIADLGALSDVQMDFLAKNLNVSQDEIKATLTSAKATWEKVKGLIEKKIPLTETQISEELEEHGHVEALIAVDFNALVADEFLHNLADKLGSSDLNEVNYEVVSNEDNNLLLKVSACVSEE